MKTSKEEAIKAINAFAEAMIDLNEVWSEAEWNEDDQITEALTEEYPYKECFNEMTLSTIDWKNEIINKLNK